MEERESIGKIILDYGRYPGEDYYCDGSIEDELLEIVTGHSPSEYPRIIEQRPSWPILYHLSPLRENIVEWVPMKKTDKVLEIGSGCGAVTGVLSRKAGSVTCVDLSKKRSLINAHRHKDCGNIVIHVGNFQDIEPGLDRDYDYICLIGALEYGQSYIGGKQPFVDYLSALKPHLAGGGRILIAIENKYGLKYFAGCQEDHLGTYFSGIENYAAGDGVRTFGRKGLERLFRACGMKESHFYYPYPDYKFMTAMYSDEYLPGKGELSANIRNFDRDRMILFDETRAFDGIVEEGLLPVFANSYLAVAGKAFPVKYVKYSGERAQTYQVRTQISREPAPEKGWTEGITVKKYPLIPEAQEHVCRIAEACAELRVKYQGGNLEIAPCVLQEEDGVVCAVLEYVDGTPLSEYFDQYLEKDDLDGFYRLLHEYMERIGYHEEYPATDYDLAFSNILVRGQRWTVIDYEWTFGKAVPAKELAFRAVYCYLLEDEKRGKLNLERFYRELSITGEEARQYRATENDFQAFVTGRRSSLAHIRELIGRRLLRPMEWVKQYQEPEEADRVQIYEDTGEGYAEERSYFLPEICRNEAWTECTVEVKGGVKVLRIDPCRASCIVRIRELTFNGRGILPESPLRLGTLNDLGSLDDFAGSNGLSRLLRLGVPGGLRDRIDRRDRRHGGILAVNGAALRKAKSRSKADQEEAVLDIVFPTGDPNIHIRVDRLEPKKENTLHIKMEIVRLPMEMAREMADAVKK
ncbi:MAG: class I SAM-dependent methyltransferase [Clostridium sp.]|jgi:precorrin-6B methylase 2|nr:class I SAM-dependent methyltransferase [Clostridium sp.]